MNSHLAAGALGAMLAVCGSSFVDDLQCKSVACQRIEVNSDASSVSIGAGCISVRDAKSGAIAVLSANGLVFYEDGAEAEGRAGLVYSAEAGAFLFLEHGGAALSLASSKAEEAAIRATIEGNTAAIIAAPDHATLGLVDRGKGALLTRSGCVADIERATQEVNRQALEAEQIVFVTQTGEKFHRANCQYLARSMIPMNLSEASRRFAPCRVCIPAGN